MNGEQLDEVELARVVVEALPNIWSKDLNDQIHRSVRAAVREVYPARARVWWHSGSVFIFCVSLMAFIYEQPEVGEIVQWFWVASFLGHALFAFNQGQQRSAQIAELEGALLPQVERLVEERKQALKAERPFSGAKRKEGVTPNYQGLISPTEAEELCAEWMALLGENKVTVTSRTNDGGIDITSERCVAQVKNYAGSVGVREVRELMGVAAVDGRTPLFFTSGTYTKAALDYANEAEVLLFRYSAEQGTLDGVNHLAREALSDSNVEGHQAGAESPAAGLVEEFLEFLKTVSIFITRNPARLFIEPAQLQTALRELETIPDRLSSGINSLAGYESIKELLPQIRRDRKKILKLIEPWGFDSEKVGKLDTSQLSSMLVDSIESPDFQPGAVTRLKEYFTSRELPHKNWTEVSSCFTILYELADLLNALNEAHEPFSGGDNQYWQEILAIGSEFQAWISMAEIGSADQTAGVILRKRFDGLIELWEESVGLEPGTVHQIAKS